MLRPGDGNDLIPLGHEDLVDVAITFDATLTLIAAGWRPRNFARAWLQQNGSRNQHDELDRLHLAVHSVYRLSDGAKLWLFTTRRSSEPRT